MQEGWRALDPALARHDDVDQDDVGLCARVSNTPSRTFPASATTSMSPSTALAVVLRLLVAQRLANTEGLVNADRQGVYEPRELAASKVLGKLAGRVAAATVKRRVAQREAEREQREQAWRAEQAAKLEAQRARLEAGEQVTCECCLRLIETAADAVEKYCSLVHAGECESKWGSAVADDDAAE